MKRLTAADHAAYRAESAARMAASDRLAESLGLDVRGAVTYARGRLALKALLDLDDEYAARVLAKLDAEQLQQVEHAAVALSLLASKMAKETR